MVTAVRRLFGYKNVIQIFAPTGGAAANAGGRTIHSGLKVGVRRKKGREEAPLCGDKKVQLMRELQHTLITIFDEFSMIDAKVLQQAQYNCRHAAHNGNNSHIPWGVFPLLY